jgi:hypothetical protein
MEKRQERPDMVDLPFINSENGVGTDFNNMFVQSKGAFVSKRFARPGMQPRGEQDGLAHIIGISKLSLGNSDNGTVPVLNDLLLDGNGITKLLKEWVLNVVDSRFGKKVVVVIVDKAADVTGWNNNFSVENVL